MAARALVVAMLLSSLAATEAGGQARSAPELLVSRADLTAAATRAEVAAAKGDPAQRAENALTAAAIRQRLRDGDLQVGDRVIVTIISDAVHRDTVVVRSGRSLELLGMIIVPVAGVLRSELQDRVSTEVLKYVKAQQIEVTPLMRVGILGAVARPGYFAFASDIPLTDAIMGAGGPTYPPTFNVRPCDGGIRSTGRLAKRARRSPAGLPSINSVYPAGDELVVGQRRELGPAGTAWHGRRAWRAVSPCSSLCAIASQ